MNSRKVRSDAEMSQECPPQAIDISLDGIHCGPPQPHGFQLTPAAQLVDGQQEIVPGIQHDKAFEVLAEDARETNSRNPRRVRHCLTLCRRRGAVSQIGNCRRDDVQATAQHPKHAMRLLRARGNPNDDKDAREIIERLGQHTISCGSRNRTASVPETARRDRRRVGCGTHHSRPGGEPDPRHLCLRATRAYDEVWPARQSCVRATRPQRCPPS